MNYRIKVYYQTGDSFGSSEEEDYISLEWTDKEEVCTALKYFKDHYDTYAAVENSYSSQAQDKRLKEEAKSKDWYIDDGYEFTLQVPLNGKMVKYSAGQWCGYFETLYGMCIEADDPEMSFRYV